MHTILKSLMSLPSTLPVKPIYKGDVQLYMEIGHGGCTPWSGYQMINDLQNLLYTLTLIPGTIIRVIYCYSHLSGIATTTKLVVGW